MTVFLLHAHALCASHIQADRHLCARFTCFIHRQKLLPLARTALTFHVVAEHPLAETAIAEYKQHIARLRDFKPAHLVVLAHVDTSDTRRRAPRAGNRIQLKSQRHAQLGNQDNIILILRIDLYHADQLIVALEVDRRKARAADAVFRCGGTLNLSILGDEQEIALFRHLI